ncbi:hypothetical protein GGF42_004099 [Coemansia sp. RSA 2424]|nr:hypothetical protein GGF42_004099 [Coemansia sp. RSA 2424]
MELICPVRYVTKPPFYSYDVINKVDVTDMTCEAAAEKAKLLRKPEMEADVSLFIVFEDNTLASCEDLLIPNEPIIRVREFIFAERTVALRYIKNKDQLVLNQ